jgi:hypothetical protein
MSQWRSAYRALRYRGRKHVGGITYVEIKTEIEIESTPERVWSILSNFPEHSRWNPFIRSMQGSAEKGQRLTISVQPKGGRTMTFRPTVLTATPNQELRWIGHFLLPGIFDGEHYFQILLLSPDRVKFVHGEKYSGVLVRFAKSILDREIKAGFMAMNQALKVLAESDTVLRNSAVRQTAA